MVKLHTQGTKGGNTFPFGSNTPRFKKNCCHPELDSSGLYVIKPKACDPCLYKPKSMSQAYNAIYVRNEKEPWRCKTELEEWSKNLGYRNQKIQAQRKYKKTILGPAWHDVKEWPKYEPACKNVNFGRVPRTRIVRDPGYPGPADYTRSVPYKAPYGPHSTRPTFEREEPCRMPDRSFKWSLAPNRYNIVDKDNIDQKPNKLVSLIGPYSLFTGPRDGTTIKNHFNDTGRVTSKSWPIDARSDLERFEKTHFGEWNKTSRDVPYRGRNGVFNLANAPRNPSDPGPAHYTVEPEHEPTQYENGFNSSYDKEPGHIPFRIWPAVGRYKIEKKTSIPGQGHKHVFLSKVKRTIGCYLPEKMNSF